MAIRPQLFDCLIIGAGPAGLSAALACARTRTTALVFDSQSYRNEGITHMHTVPSRDHIDPYEFRRISREQIESRYHTVWFENTTVTSAVKKILTSEGDYEGFEVKDKEKRTYLGKKLILATGSRDVFPDIPGYAENWPTHIYQCLACDGYEQSNTPIGILDFTSPMAIHMALMAQNFDSRVTIYSNGPVDTAWSPAMQMALTTASSLSIPIDSRHITRLVNNGPSHLDGITIHFETGEPVTLGFLVHRPATVNRAQDLVEMLGLETVDEMGGVRVVVNGMFNETSVPGCFAAGDTMGFMKQVTIAMAEGLKAVSGAGMQILGERAEGAVKMAEGK